MSRMSPAASSSRSALRSLQRTIAPSSTRSVRSAPGVLASVSPLQATSISSPLSACQPRSRGFFSLPDIHKLAGQLTGATEENEAGRGVETDGEFQKFHARKILPSVVVGLPISIPHRPSTKTKTKIKKSGIVFTDRLIDTPNHNSTRSYLTFHPTRPSSHSVPPPASSLERGKTTRRDGLGIGNRMTNLSISMRS